MLPNINFYSANNLITAQNKRAGARTESRKSIEMKMSNQSEELMKSAKIIEDLKNQLSYYIDRYNKIKVDLEKEKQRSIQISLGLKSKKFLPKKETTQKSFYFAITNFSLYYPKGIKRSKSQKEIKVLKERLEKIKNEKNCNEKELDLLKNEFLNNKEELNNLREELVNEKNETQNKNLIMKEYDTKFMQLQTDIENEKSKNKNTLTELDKLNEVLNTLHRERDETNNKITILKNDLVLYKKNEILYKQKIKAQKEEIDRLKCDMLLNFHKTKGENEELMTQINLLNDKLINLNFDKGKNNKCENNNLYSGKPGTAAGNNSSALKEENIILGLKNKELVSDYNKLLMLTKTKDKKNIDNLKNVKECISNFNEKNIGFIKDVEKNVNVKLGNMNSKINKIMEILKKVNSCNNGCAGINDKAKEIESDKDKMSTNNSNSTKDVKDKELIQSLKNELNNNKNNSLELECSNKELHKKVEIIMVDNKEKTENKG